MKMKPGILIVKERKYSKVKNCFKLKIDNVGPHKNSAKMI